jgi:hypothetical protein
MMLTMLLSGVFGLAAVLAAASMVATWLEYGSAWDAVDAEMRNGKPMPTRHVTVRISNNRQAAAAFRVAEIRAVQPAFQSRHGLRAAV